MPIPGSPLISVSEPLISPPPSTRFSSPMPVSIRSVSPETISRMGAGLMIRRSRFFEDREAEAAVSAIFSSVKLFQAPQMHCPIHLGLS